MFFLNIFVLLVSLFSINFNTNDFISSRNSLRSINIAEEVVNLPVPNEGYVENVYFNANLSIEEAVSILSTLTYIETPFLSYPVYPILFSNDGTPVVFVVKDDNDYEINIAYDLENEVYERIFLSYDLGFGEKLGWHKTECEINKSVISDYSGLPIGFLNQTISQLVSITSFDNVDNDVETNINDYNKGYQDGYNAANNTSVFSPDNLQLVFTLPVNYGNSSDIAYWPVDRDIFSNWFSGGSFDFISTSFFNEWLDFYNDTQDPLIDLNESYTFTMFLDFNSPVSIYDLSFEGFGFSAWAYEYSSTSSLIWNYAQGSSDREYYFKSPTLIRNEDTPVASLLVKSIYLQFTMNLSSGTSSVSSNVLKFSDISIDDYNQGFILGQESGFNSGFNAGQQDGLKQGFNDGYTEAEEYYKPQYEYLLEQYNALNENYNEFLNEEYTLPKLFWSIGSIPFETFKTIWNVDFLRF